MSVILKAEHISKQYRLGLVGTGTLSHDLNRWWHRIRGQEDPYLKIGETNDRSTKGNSDYVWALRDINFEVHEGEVLGIIGKNGAGKSTLLKILSKVTSPTTGSIKTRGRIASLLEVGTGFHGEMTGRENIYLNGAILGMTKAEITSKLAEIISFSGCERYIDTPVKRYSSGMTVRLAFAVAAFLEPEILVVDEVLAVGDAEFQKKAIGKMQDISKTEGRTVLFVSHNMAAVRNLCTRSIVMENGSVVFDGEVNLGIDYYIQQVSSGIHTQVIKNDRGVLNLEDYSISTIQKKIFRSGNSIELGDQLCIKIQLSSKQSITDLGIAMDLQNSKEELVAHLTNEDDGFFISNLQEGVMTTISIKTNPLVLIPGNYVLNLWFGEGHLQELMSVKNFITFNIEQSNYTKRTRPLPKHSAFYLHSKWERL